MPVLYNVSKIHDDPSGPKSVQNAKYGMLAICIIQLSIHFQLYSVRVHKFLYVYGVSCCSLSS